MSYHSQHMGMRIAGIRVSVEIKTYQEVAMLLRGITWENIRFRMVSFYEYGNTLYSDLFIILNYFKEGFIMYRAAERCGYRGGEKLNRKGQLTNRIKYRLMRMNFDYILDIAIAMIQANLITTADIATIITRQTTGKGKRPERHPVYKYYTKRLVTEAIERWGHAGAAKSLGVSEAWIIHWDNMDVANILVTPRN